MRTTEERFWAKVDKSGECWLWTGGKTSRGYGVITIQYRATYVHRYSMQLAGRLLGPGEMACHRCDTPLCVRPDHLFAGSALDNAADMIAKGRNEPLRRPKSAETRRRMSVAFRKRFQEHPETHYERMKTHCPQGHEYTPENTSLNRGHRHCRECGRIRCRADYWRRKTA